MSNWSTADVERHMERMRKVNTFNALTGPEAIALAKQAPKVIKPRQNKTEAAYEGWLSVRRLVGDIHGYAFQPCRWQLAERCSYQPDFMVCYPEGRIDFVDCKGTKGDRYWIEEDSKIKIRCCAEKYRMFGWVITWCVKGEWREERF